MTVEVYSNRFKVQEVEESDQRYKVVKKVNMVSDNSSIIIDVHTNLIDIKNDAVLNIIIYKGDINEKEIPEDYNYLVCGKLYEMNIHAEMVEYIGSFGGMQFILKSDKAIEELDDRCDITLGIQTY
ncbi:hypothetical protein BDAP_002418 [Binucleata daphniae]